MTDKLEAFLADYEDRLGRWHDKGDMYERGFKLTALVRVSTRLIGGLDGLLIAYRLGKRPSEKVLDAAINARAKLEAIKAELPTEPTDE